MSQNKINPNHISGAAYIQIEYKMMHLVNTTAINAVERVQKTDPFFKNLNK